MPPTLPSSSSSSLPAVGESLIPASSTSSSSTGEGGGGEEIEKEKESNPMPTVGAFTYTALGGAVPFTADDLVRTSR